MEFAVIASALICRIEKPLMRSLALMILLSCSGQLLSKSLDSLLQKVDGSLYFDTYYSFDFNDPNLNERPAFIYNYDQHNQVAINMALARMSYSEKRFGINIGLMTGTYAAANLSHEPQNLQHLYEANMVLNFNKRKTRQLTIGVFESHLGFESAISINNPTLTRSLSAENSPYYLSGLRYTSHIGKKLTINLLAVNGWQRIKRENFNSIPALGTQFTYQPNKKTLFNWSTYFGSEGPDSISDFRLFNNLYTQLGLGDKVNITIGFDLGLQRSGWGNGQIRAWYCPTAIFEFLLPDHQALTLRLEHYQNRVDFDLSTTGMSLGYKRIFYEKLVWKSEMRFMNDYSYPFEKDGLEWHNNAALTTSLVILID